MYYKKIVLLFLTVLFSIQGIAQRFPDASVPAPKEWTGKIFHLSQDYPTSVTPEKNLPWLKYDYKTQPTEYIMAVYNYILEGNIEADWIVQDNKVRKWYHAPWMHYRISGGVDMAREPLNGITRERDSRPHELSPVQETVYQNWAVGFYNPAGGYTVGQVWKDHNHPDPSKALFPEGTVSAKVIFTEADSTEVPYLKGAASTTAYVYRKAWDSTKRELKKMHLLQIDFSVKDSRAKSTTGWIMGNLVYNGDVKNENPWLRVMPVGLSWGNDAGVTPENVKDKPLYQTYINPSIRPIAHLGWAGRLNGMIDNPQSSCISCHGSASFPFIMEGAPSETNTTKERLSWFNVNANENTAYLPGTISLDYSLQLAIGIGNFYSWKIFNQKRTVSEKIVNRLQSWKYPDVLFCTLLIIVGLVFFLWKQPRWAFNYRETSENNAIFLVRVLIGIIMIYHGVPKILGGLPAWLSLGQTLANFGIFFHPVAWGYMAAATETIGGLLLVLGLLTRPVAFMLCFNMIIASSKHLFSGQGIDAALHPLSLLAVFVFLLLTGPGKFSIDYKFYLKSNSK